MVEGLRRRWIAAGAGAVATALVGTSLTLGSAGPAEASVVEPLESVYSDVVFGDVLSVGNGSLRCPTAADGTPLRAGTSYEACAQAQKGVVSGNNNDYFMKQNDTDGRAETFNGSSAVIDVPAGATITYAALEWGGHTGEFRLANGNTSALVACNIVGQQYPEFRSSLPAAPAAASPEAQQVGLSVDGSEPVLLDGQITRDSLAAWPSSSDRFYTGWADVTDLMDGLDLAGTTEVTVTNVWAPEGVNCTAGWALTVVWAFDAPEPDVAEYAQQIDIVRGHVRQAAGEASTTVDITGFETVSSIARVGLVAYEGDRGSVGDRFLVNGTLVAEPTGFGTTNDFFVSSATGASSPDWPVNFSVDVNDFSTTLIPVSSTEARLGFVTNGDGYWMQSLWLATAVAQVSITKSADADRGRVGDEVEWTLTVRNDSPVPLSGTVVVDSQVDACSKDIGHLDPFEEVTYTCTSQLPAGGITNSATVTALSENGSEVTDTDEASVEAISPALAVTKTTDHVLYADGEQVLFTVVVENVGDVPLSDVEVTDPTVAGCSVALGVLAPGEVRQVTCSAAAPVVGNSNTVLVDGLDPLGRAVTAEATVPVVVANPGLVLTKTASTTEVRPGDVVLFTVTVINTGDVRLDDVVVADPSVPACSGTVASLLPGETFSSSCTWVAGPDSFTNVATVDGAPTRCGADPDCVGRLGSDRIGAEAEVTVVVDRATSPTTPGTGTTTRPDGRSEPQVEAAEGGGGPSSAAALASTGARVVSATILAALALGLGGVLLRRRTARCDAEG